MEINVNFYSFEYAQIKVCCKPMFDTLIRGRIGFEENKERLYLNGYDYMNDLKYCPFCSESMTYKDHDKEKTFKVIKEEEKEKEKKNKYRTK